MTGLDEASRAALRQPALLKAAVELHARPAAYVQPERLAGLGFAAAALFARLAATPRGERRLSELLARRANLPAEGFFRFAEDRFRVALLPFATLERLFSLAAAATLRGEIVRVVDRPGRERLQAATGAEPLAFALKEAAATLGPLCVDHWGAEPGTGLEERFRRNRTRCLEDCLAGAPAALTERLRLKLPNSWDADFSLPTPPERAETSWTIVRRLLRAKIPERGGPCFA